MKKIELIKKWLCGTCILYTGIAVFLLILGSVSSKMGGMVRTSSFLLILPCSALISLANRLLLSAWSVPPVRCILHYVITVLSVFLLLWYPVNTDKNGASALLILVFFTVVYWVVFGLVVLFRNRVRKLLEKD